jgi:two-component system cell cycle response regulator DivK
MVPQQTKGRVLVVDDCDDVRLMWRRILSSAGYDVIEAQDGGEGIRQAEINEPDVILMDLWMPGIDGITAVVRLKGNAATAQLPVIALSGDLFGADRARAAGFDAFLLKPVRPAQLLNTISQVMTSRSATAAATALHHE